MFKSQVSFPLNKRVSTSNTKQLLCNNLNNLIVLQLEIRIENETNVLKSKVITVNRLRTYIEANRLVEMIKDRVDVDNQ